VNGEGSDTLLNGGFRLTINPKMNLLFALGHTVTHAEGETTSAELCLGVQLEL
jgi:hypothetical protein